MRYFSSLSDLSISRWGHGCGTINAQDGSGNKEVVAAGDLKSSEGSDSVEIYSFADDSWRSGNLFALLLLRNNINKSILTTK